ncbi:MAG: signal protein PDZ [Betaproteobacteria bacterium RBG_16_64_18]|nr:MAG: signal protein PDZ [Betaproteobacteria bacterium RBG_16_64_18]OGA09490.1 MAG: signal protein PDZ [Betaproteobacteria bacterium RIFCSPLOWO2_02_FULL_65_20]OGA42254.1 MAG: signal protein PDZ [Betaproteobacteria bacterium RIFCSPLOWO2_12_FULL_65_110]
MAESRNWAFPQNLQPRPEEVDFDLDAALDSVVLLRAEIPETAFTAPILGTERAGYGVVIREDGLILTIGYLITEAASVWLTSNNGVAVAGHPLAFDQATGFGLVLPLGRLGAPAIECGSAATVDVGDEVIVIGQGGRAHALKARLVARREFAGYWEYLLEDALYTAPAHPQWGGTALVGADGRLLGIGSLLVQDREALGGEAGQGNMFVPIDLLEPILDELLKFGRRAGPPRPWLGLYVAEVQGQLVVSGVAEGGPAARAGLRKGDVVVELAGARVSGAADLYRRLWRLGPAGVEVPLTLARNGEQVRALARSVDRNDLFTKPKLH